MPISPLEVKVKIDSINKSLMEKCKANIDENLMSVEYVRECRCRNADNMPAYFMTFDGSLSAGEIKHLTDAYLAVGWFSVKVENYTDRGWKITLASNVLVDESL